MTEILQLTHFVQDHGMTQMQVGGSRVQAQLDAQRLAALFGARQLLRKFAFDEQFVDAALGDGQRFLDFIGQGQRGLVCGLFGVH